MRLLRTTPSAEGDFTIDEYLDDAVLRYSILSHTWGAEEVTLQDMQSGRAASKKGFAKVAGCCALARANGYEHVWIDTCCIDKTSSAELSEAINSMYRWYQKADICYAYLADVDIMAMEEDEGQHFSLLTMIKNSRWFTRGWTLQELIAPTHLIFLDGSWSEIGARTDLAAELEGWTGIPANVLTGAEDIDTLSVAQRMSWASERHTARIEDQAYCLMGLFDINMPLIYGEGSKAFLRLQEEIIRVLDDQSIFAWRANKDSGHQGLLATSPRDFRDSADIIIHDDILLPAIESSTPLVVNSKGIHLEVPFVAVGREGLGLALLSCVQASKPYEPIGLYMRDASLTLQDFDRVWYDQFEPFDLRDFRPPQYPLTKMCVQQPRQTRQRHQNQHQQRWNTPWERTASDRELIMFRHRMKSFTSKALTKLGHEARQHLVRTVEYGDEEQMKQLLLLGGLDFLKYNNDRRSHLSHAAEHGHTDIVWALLMRPAVKPNGQDRDARTPLSYAAEKGHTEVVWLLLARSDVQADVRDLKALTPLMHAAKSGHGEIVDMILSRDLTSTGGFDFQGRSALSHASEHGHLRVARRILSKTISELDVCDVNGLTPLAYATKNRHLAVMALLLGQGADTSTMALRTPETAHFYVEGPNLGLLTPIWLALKNGDFDGVELLLQHGIDTDVVGEVITHTPLVWSVVRRDFGMARLLASYDADISSLGVCPFKAGQFIIWAVKMDDHTLARRLLSHFAQRLHGTDTRIINVQDDEGNTVLHWAVRMKNATLVEYVLIYKPKADMRNKDGQTPLHYAVLNQDPTVVQLLIKAGAKGDVEDHDGKTPMSLALEHESVEIQRLLEPEKNG